MGFRKSLPSRGAWIEIPPGRNTRLSRPVAPLTGSVDRNHAAISSARDTTASLPSRGAWIEMGIHVKKCTFRPVAPLTGSVDRNIPLFVML